MNYWNTTRIAFKECRDKPDKNPDRLNANHIRHGTFNFPIPSLYFIAASLLFIPSSRYTTTHSLLLTSNLEHTLYHPPKMTPAPLTKTLEFEKKNQNMPKLPKR